MKIDIKINFDLKKLDIGEINRIGLSNSTQALVKIAAANAPYETGTLKKSIGVEPATITKSTTQARVGPRKVVYAVRREFENKKNPSRKFYMKRTSEVAEKIVQDKFNEAVEIVKKSI